MEVREHDLSRPLAWLLAVVLFTGIAPTLTWLEFSSGSENLVVATALEMRRSGQWWRPTLAGEPRTRKPPLAAWVAAAAIDDGLLARLDHPDSAQRERAYRDLAWRTRGPVLLLCVLMLVGVYETGRVLHSGRLGLWAMASAGTMLLVLRFGRAATTDVHLAFWAAAANLCFLWAIVGRRWWLGLGGAGAALGMGLMAKGPVVLVQSALPMAAFAAWRCWAAGTAWRWDWLGPAAWGLGLMLAVALPWPLSVYLSDPATLNQWRAEVLREGATSLQADPWWTYLVILPWTLPWLAGFVGGLLRLAEPDRPRAVVAGTLMLLAPLAVMSGFADKNERYLLPMAGGAGLLAAVGLLLATPSQRRAYGLLHWAALGVMTLGLPTACLTVLRTPAGGPWLEVAEAIVGGMAAAAALTVGALLARRSADAVPFTTAAVMLILAAMFVSGYRKAEGGPSELRPVAESIRAVGADMPAYYLANPHSPRPLPPDLLIYLNRTVRKVESAEQVPDGPAVLVLLQRHRREPAPAIPQGWKKAAEHRWTKDTWHVLVRDSR